MRCDMPTINAHSERISAGFDFFSFLSFWENQQQINNAVTCLLINFKWKSFVAFTTSRLPGQTKKKAYAERFLSCVALQNHLIRFCLFIERVLPNFLLKCGSKQHLCLQLSNMKIDFIWRFVDFSQCFSNLFNSNRAQWKEVRNNLLLFCLFFYLLYTEICCLRKDSAHLS